MKHAWATHPSLSTFAERTPLITLLNFDKNDVQTPLKFWFHVNFSSEYDYVK